MNENANDGHAMILPDDVSISVILTKRELFAAMAMQGLCAGKMGEVANEKRIAEIAVKQADALLKKIGEDDNGGSI